MKKESTSIGIVTVISALSIIIFGWNSWISLEIIKQSNATASTLGWQQNTDASLVAYQASNDVKIGKIIDDITDVKIKTGVTNELVKLISDQYHINATAVEQQVKTRIQIEEALSSTTAIIQ